MEQAMDPETTDFEDELAFEAIDDEIADDLCDDMTAVGYMLDEDDDACS